MNIQVEIGQVSQCLSIDELTIRAMDLEDVFTTFTSEDDFAPPIPRTELRLQGRLRNTTKKLLTEVRYDVSYYDQHGAFLGLDRSGMLEDADIDVEDFLTIDMAIRMPDETHQCVFNVRGKRARFIDRLL